MLPFLPDTSDPRMEYSAEEGGWVKPVDAEGDGGMGTTVWRVVAFVSDICLSESRIPIAASRLIAVGIRCVLLDHLYGSRTLAVLLLRMGAR